MRSLSPAQAKALRNARDHGSATRGLSGQSEFGGWSGTRSFMLRHGYLDRELDITELGRWRLAIDLGEIPKDTPPPEPAAAAPAP
jgi:hypothetical protein